MGEERYPNQKAQAERRDDQVIKALAPAVLGALLTAFAAAFTFGERLGNATATAQYWQAYVEGIAKLPACR